MTHVLPNSTIHHLQNSSENNNNLDMNANNHNSSMQVNNNSNSMSSNSQANLNNFNNHQAHQALNHLHMNTQNLAFQPLGPPPSLPPTSSTTMIPSNFVFPNSNPISSMQIHNNNRNASNLRPPNLKKPTDQTGCDVEAFLVNTLRKNPRDRLTIYTLEKDMRDFCSNEAIYGIRFPKMTSYHRMLVHRIATVFGLDHNVDDTGRQVVCHKTINTRIPTFQLEDLVKAADQKDEMLRKSGQNGTIPNIADLKQNKSGRISSVPRELRKTLNIPTLTVPEDKIKEMDKKRAEAKAKLEAERKEKEGVKDSDDKKSEEKIKAEERKKPERPDRAARLKAEEKTREKANLQIEEYHEQNAKATAQALSLPKVYQPAPGFLNTNAPPSGMMGPPPSFHAPPGLLPTFNHPPPVPLLPTHPLTAGPVIDPNLPPMLPHLYPQFPPGVLLQPTAGILSSGNVPSFPMNHQMDNRRPSNSTSVSTCIPAPPGLTQQIPTSNLDTPISQHNSNNNNGIYNNAAFTVTPNEPETTTNAIQNPQGLLDNPITSLQNLPIITSMFNQTSSISFSQDATTSNQISQNSISGSIQGSVHSLHSNNNLANNSISNSVPPSVNSPKLSQHSHPCSNVSGVDSNECEETLKNNATLALAQTLLAQNSTGGATSEADIALQVQTQLQNVQTALETQQVLNEINNQAALAEQAQAAMVQAEYLNTYNQILNNQVSSTTSSDVIASVPQQVNNLNQVNVNEVDFNSAQLYNNLASSIANLDINTQLSQQLSSLSNGIDQNQNSTLSNNHNIPVVSETEDAVSAQVYGYYSQQQQPPQPNTNSNSYYGNSNTSNSNSTSNLPAEELHYFEIKFENTDNLRQFEAQIPLRFELGRRSTSFG